MSKAIHTSNGYEVYIESENSLDVFSYNCGGLELMTFTKQDLLDMLKLLEDNEDAKSTSDS